MCPGLSTRRHDRWPKWGRRSAPRHGRGIARRCKDSRRRVGIPFYLTIAEHGDGIEVVIPPRSSAVRTGEPGSPARRDRHLAMITKQGRLAWQISARFVDQIRRITDTKYYDKTWIYRGKLHLLSGRQRIAQFHHVDRYNDHRKEELLDLAEINLIIVN
jgi:hypothetical protein